MNARRRLAIALATAVLSGGLAGPALATDTITVDAAVTAAAPCLIGPSEAIDFGSHLFSANNADQSAASRQVVYTSCSGIDERVFGRATNATNGNGSVEWTLAPGLQRCPEFGLNTFLLQLNETFGLRLPSIVFSSTDQEIELLAPGASSNYRDVWLVMPCVGSDGAGQSMSFQIIYTATF